jgi:hypothetical protein
MTGPIQYGEYPVIDDDRVFSLIDYVHGHGHALLRGFPETATNWSSLRVLDLAFGGIKRINCWRDFTPLRLREATPSQVAALEERLGRVGSGVRVFLLQADSLEDYIMSYGMSWAEFDLPGGAPSPLLGDREYLLSHPPVNGVIYDARERSQ